MCFSKFGSSGVKLNCQLSTVSLDKLTSICQLLWLQFKKIFNVDLCSVTKPDCSV